MPRNFFSASSKKTIASFGAIGAVALSLLSIPQKIALNADPFTAKGFVVPIVFGALTGVFLGYIYIRNRFLLLKDLESQQEIQDRDRLLRDMVASIPGVVYQFKIDGDGVPSFPYISQTVKNVFGIDPEAIVRDPEALFGVVQTEDRPGLDASISQSYTSLTPWLWEGRAIKLSGEVSWFRGASTPRKLDDGSVLWNGVLHDITDLHDTQEELQTAHDELEGRAEEDKRKLDFQRLAIDEHAIVSITNVSGDIIYANDKFCDISGYSREELLGRNHRILKSSDHSPEFYQDLWRTIASGKPWHGEIKNLKKGGGCYWVKATIVPFLNEAGKPFQYVAIRTDISERKLAEQSLHITEERYERSLNFANIGTWDWDIHTGDLHWSEQIGPLFGHEAGVLETTYDNFVAAIHPDDRQRVTEAVTACVEDGVEYNIEHRVVWPDGTVRHLLEKGDVVRDEDGQPINMLGVVRDITDRKTAELALRESEQRYQKLVELSPIAVMVHKVGKIVFANAAAAEFLGTASPEQLLNKRLLEIVPPEFHEIVLQRIDNIERNNTTVPPMELKLVRFDGRTIYAESAAAPIPYQDGTGILSVFSDITERKNTEDQLRSAKEAADLATVAKSEFLATMSHELRTPLNAIIGLSDTIAQQIFGPIGNDKYAEYIGDIKDSGQHLLELINDILDVSAIEASKLEIHEENIDTVQVIDAAIRLIRPRSEKRKVGIVSDVGESLPMLYADERRLKQILLNLLSNAVKFSEENSNISIEAGLADDSSMVFVVSDTGIGMDEKEIVRAMEAFGQIDSTQARKFEGTGLGLPLTKSLTELHGGTFEIESEKGIGTAVTVKFPKERTVGDA